MEKNKLDFTPIAGLYRAKKKINWIHRHIEISKLVKESLTPQIRKQQMEHILGAINKCNALSNIKKDQSEL